MFCKQSSSSSITPPGKKFVAALRTWYAQHARTLPWRLPPQSCKGQNPYYVLVSEVMLQQTTVQTVIPYYKRFIQRWPTIRALAEASLDDVLHAWQGLGYYTRARSLHKAAQHICKQHAGDFPSTMKLLESLPGIGPYTAGAILSIAFQKPVPAVDGNVARIFSRVYSLKEQGTHLIKKVASLNWPLVAHTSHPGHYTQALMDLGSRICKPQKPVCGLCPLSPFCHSAKTHTVHLFPRKNIKKLLPKRYGHFFWAQDQHTRKYYLEKEKERLLNGLLRPLRSNFATKPTQPEFPYEGKWQHLGVIHHTFTHFRLTINIWHAMFTEPLLESNSQQEGVWLDEQSFAAHAFSTLTKKAICFLPHEAPTLFTYNESLERKAG